jgi:hypothetical protein
MTDVTFTQNKLEIGDNEIQLTYEIKDVLEVDDVIVVLQNPKGDLNDDDEIVTLDTEGKQIWRNIIGFDKDGIQIWRIEAPSQGQPSHPWRYTYIKLEEGILIANNWNGYKYIVDPKTGDIDKFKKHMKG